MKKGFVVIDSKKIKPVECPCGLSTCIITARDTPLVNLHITHISNSSKHYHLKCTEFYFILEGKGQMELEENDIISLTPGIVVMIRPGVPHRGYGDFKAMIVGVPAMEENDEFFVSKI
jgi:mannose-6-phosphate isomerase-like protein (cupin superfamily)